MREFHPLTTVFPLMDGKAFQELVEDIKTHGLRHPIIIDTDGRIVDGRNRARACHQLGEEDPEYRLWDGDGSLTAYVVSVNLHRRHLSTSQRGLIAAQLTTTSRTGGASQHLREGIPSLDIDQAAGLLNVSPDTVQRGRLTLSHGDPDLLADVQAGNLTLNGAEAIIRGKKDKQEDRTGVKDRKTGHQDRDADVAKLRALAAEGWATRQVAKSLKRTEDWCRRMLKIHDIPCPGDKAIKGRKRIQANDLMDKVAFSAEYVMADVDLIDPSDLDPARIPGWITSLKVARRSIDVFIRQLTDRKDKQHVSKESTHTAGCKDISGATECHAISPGPSHTTRVP